jgi:2-dehydropantoate 2-reductase
LIVGVVGAGALGTVFGAALARTCDVRVLTRDTRSARAIANRGGLVVDDGPARFVHVSHEPDVFDGVDIVLLAVKTFATAEALRPLRSLHGKRTPIVSIQNGLEAVERIEFSLGHSCCIALAPTTEAARRIESGHAHHVAPGKTYAGWVEGHEGGSELDAFVEACRAGGLAIEHVQPIEPYVWAKLVASAAINLPTALAGIPNGELLERPAERERVARLAREVADVARRLGIVLPFEDAAEHALGVALATGPNRSSMLSDLEAGRPTEVEAIAGAVARHAAATGVAVPETLRARDEVRARTKA